MKLGAIGKEGLALKVIHSAPILGERQLNKSNIAGTFF